MKVLFVGFIVVFAAVMLHRALFGPHQRKFALVSLGLLVMGLIASSVDEWGKFGFVLSVAVFAVAVWMLGLESWYNLAKANCRSGRE